jgi:hypothetical protein
MLHLECKPDEVLARKLGRTRKQCLHHNDKGRVCNALKRAASCTGMIDEDPDSAQPLYLATLTEQSSEHDVRVLRDEKRNHRVVIIRPRLEEWLIKTAQTSGIEMDNFGLSDHGNELHREINARLPKVEELIAALLKARSARLLHLQSLIA